MHTLMNLYMTDLKEYSVLSKKEVMVLAEKRDSAETQWERDYYRNKIVEGNAPLVVNIAKKYAKYADLEDLVQAGNKTLLRAAEKYDHKRGFKFSTYATWWIKQGINRFLEENKIVHVPVHQQQIITKLKKLGHWEYLQELNPEDPRTKDVVATLLNNIHKKTLPHPKKYILKQRFVEGEPAMLVSKQLGLSEGIIEVMEVEGIEELRKKLDWYQALSERQTETWYRGEDNQFEPIGAQEEPEHAFERGYLESLLGTLDRREQFIIRQRYLKDRTRTLDRLGKKLNITKERVRQIEAKALKKLRRRANSVWWVK
ncbi:MAG: sigma-70 family RNA polymerase sigma factor [Candidatus Aenigmarchaeota archaeon]|nr:sigma-70 family RNA polymerase sigma factor [Candidatus Aenigmarchaeota archaeon]